MLRSRTDEVVGYESDDGFFPAELPAANINITVRRLCLSTKYKTFFLF